MKYSDALSWAGVSCKKIWLLLSGLRGDWFGPSTESLEWLFLYMDCIALFTVAGSNNGSCISTAEGSSLVRLGNTIVVCGVKGVSTNSRHENSLFPWCSVFWPSANQKRETNMRKIKRIESDVFGLPWAMLSQMGCILKQDVCGHDLVDHSV